MKQEIILMDTMKEIIQGSENNNNNNNNNNKKHVCKRIKFCPPWQLYYHITMCIHYTI